MAGLSVAGEQMLGVYRGASEECVWELKINVVGVTGAAGGGPAYPQHL